MKFELNRQKTLDNIPSASGLVKSGSFLYVIGDDSPFLFKLNKNFREIERIPLLFGEQRERVPKPVKADFESLEVVSGNEIIAVGSGSLSPQRDLLTRIIVGEKAAVEHFSLTSFYSRLKDLKLMKGSELNIEASAFYEDQLYLFNRRKNVIFSLKYRKFLLALINATPFPEINTTAVDLPKLKGIEAGFSGATFTASGKLLVTASVEDTYNAYDDGEVFGSYIGISSGVKNGIFEDFIWTSISSEVPLKVESVCVLEETSETEISVALVTDSDGAESLILTGTLFL